MNTSGIPTMIVMWLAVNVGALVVLAVVSVLVSVYALDLLESFDRWLRASEVKRSRTYVVSAPSKGGDATQHIGSLGASVQCDFFHLLEKEPNQTPEPTPLRVTPAADAPVAPRTGVAHL